MNLRKVALVPTEDTGLAEPETSARDEYLHNMGTAQPAVVHCPGDTVIQ